jgi:hypothetical protein
MTQSDVFALKNSGLNSFLFAEVGTEANGSILTVLSVLARLGQDPWVQAAQWVKLPKSDIIDRLANSIAQMPLPPQALVDARQTATRLIKLLPSSMINAEQSNAAAPILSRWPRWAPAAVIVFTLAVFLGCIVLLAPHMNDTPPVPFAQTGSVAPAVPSN